MKTVISYPAYVVVDLDQKVIDITAADCDVKNPARRRFCIPATTGRGEAFYQEVLPFNVWDYYEALNKPAELAATVARAESDRCFDCLFALTNCGEAITGDDRRPREQWIILRPGQKVLMRGRLLEVIMVDRCHAGFAFAPAPASLEAAPAPVPATPRTFEQYAELVAALEKGPIRIGSLTLEKGASRYLMRDERSGNNHSLEISETCPKRLAAHWLGFVSNAEPNHGEDVVILLPVNLPNGRRVYDRDKVALIDYLDNIASVEGHPLHGVEFRIYFSPSSVDGPAVLWGDRDKIAAANLAQLVADFLANCPAE